MLLTNDIYNTHEAQLGIMGVVRFQKQLVSGLIAILALLVALVPMVSHALPGLGISISLVNDGPTDAERSGSLWVGVEQGQSVTRTMNIRSLSNDTTQSLEFELYDIIRTDEGKVTDYTQPSALTQWLVVSPATPEVAPGETISVTLTFSAPENANDAAFDAVLRVLASGVETGESAEEDGTRAVVKTKLAIETNLWLGVGDALTLEPNFEIESVDGALIEGKKYIRIFFRNDGLVSIEPVGRFQLSDPAFVERVFEPIDFESEEILSGQLGFVDVPVPDDVIDGIYRSFITAQAGSVRKTQLFEGEIIFDDPNALSIPELAIRISIFVIAALGLVFGFRLLRSKPKKSTEQEPAPKATTDQDAVELLRQTVERLEAQLVEISKEAIAVKTKPRSRTALAGAATKPVAARTKALSQPAAKTAVSVKPPTAKPVATKPANTKGKLIVPAPKEATAKKRADAKQSETGARPAPKSTAAKRPAAKKE